MDVLRFRDINLFNYVILAKQSWNLFCKPNGLWAKVLKSLYHLHVELTKSKCSQKESWS